MSTAEDVFYLYERNSRHYYDCKKQNNMLGCKADCKDCWDNICYCVEKQEVMPFTIGDQDVPCRLKNRCYIRPGDECPICCEGILTKINAFITSCGHHYHKKCLIKYMETKWLNTKYTSVIRCPICRCSIGHPDFVQRYHDSYFSTNYRGENQFDKLEDFWISKDYKLPCFCSNGYNHYLGFDKECFCCERYRENGDLIYEITQET
jgi:Ring finger domain